jgi:hypothetical protein
MLLRPAASAVCIALSHACLRTLHALPALAALPVQMFEMDAFVGVDVLGLSFMKGEQPHAGFPEAAYHSMAEQLARAGYRVVVVEQVHIAYHSSLCSKACMCFRAAPFLCV